MSDYNRVGNDPDLKNQIVNLGLTYNLLTEYTSFIAVDNLVRETPDKSTKTVNQPLPLPQNVNAHAVGGGTVPEPGPLLLLPIAALALLRRWFKMRAKAQA